MYEPAEDSELLAEVVRQHARGRVLDMGTGSGVLARTAHEQGLNTLAVDIDPHVIHTLRAAPFAVALSDGFTRVSGQFDTIVCNPPYLPNDEQPDIALHGGPKGYEYAARIITEAKEHLTPQGQLLLLISTLTKPRIVERTLHQQGYRWHIVARKKLFMEELLVYRATLVLGVPATLLGEGARSVVYRTQEGAVKISSALRAKKEAMLLRAVNKQGIGPRLIRCDEDKVVMQYVRGEPFNQYVERTRDMRAITQLLNQARTLDTLGLNKQEFTRPGKNILVTARKRVVLLDFERATYATKPRNVTQAATWAGRFLHCAVRRELELYKHAPTTQHYAAVLRALGLSGKQSRRRA